MSVVVFKVICELYRNYIKKIFQCFIVESLQYRNFICVCICVVEMCIKDLRGVYIYFGFKLMKFGLLEDLNKYSVDYVNEDCFLLMLSFF